MPFKEELEYFCPDCRVTFRRISIQGQFPDKGCPRCGEVPEDFTRISEWWEETRGRRKGKRIYYDTLARR